MHGALHPLSRLDPGRRRLPRPTPRRGRQPLLVSFLFPFVSLSLCLRRKEKRRKKKDKEKGERKRESKEDRKRTISHLPASPLFRVIHSKLLSREEKADLHCLHQAFLDRAKAFDSGMFAPPFPLPLHHPPPVSLLRPHPLFRGAVRTGRLEESSFFFLSFPPLFAFLFINVR